VSRTDLRTESAFFMQCTTVVGGMTSVSYGRATPVERLLLLVLGKPLYPCNPMAWHYYDTNGEKIGPIRGSELKALAQQGAITPETRVEDGEGRSALARNVTGLTFPILPVSPPPPQQWYCTNCGNPVSEQAPACMSCGAKPVGYRKYCRKCGGGLKPEQVVCTKCGAKIEGTVQRFANAIKDSTSQFFGSLNNAGGATPEIETSDFESATSQYNNGSSGKINKVIIVKNTVQGVDTMLASLFPFWENPHADRFEKKVSNTLSEYNRQGWNVVSMTYGFIPRTKLPILQSLLVTFCWFLLISCTLGIYLPVYMWLVYFSRSKGQYTIVLEKTIGSENTNGNL